jgi:uncharacterized protein (UPF0548 family)
VSIRIRRPGEHDLRLLLDAAVSDSTTYEPAGVTSESEPPPGYHLDRYTRRLGSAGSDFVAASEAIRTWQVQRGAGLIVCVDGPPSVGANVAMAAPLPIGFIDVVCRVIAVEDKPDRFGFTYGTLSAHPERGEERFTVIRRTDGEVVFEIVAVSRPRHFLARAFSPIARRLQRAATARYLDAMSAAVSAD